MKRGAQFALKIAQTICCQSISHPTLHVLPSSERECITARLGHPLRWAHDDYGSIRPGGLMQVAWRAGSKTQPLEEDGAQCGVLLHSSQTC